MLHLLKFTGFSSNCSSQLAKINYYVQEENCNLFALNLTSKNLVVDVLNSCNFGTRNYISFYTLGTKNLIQNCMIVGNNKPVSVKTDCRYFNKYLCQKESRTSIKPTGKLTTTVGTNEVTKKESKLTKTLIIVGAYVLLIGAFGTPFFLIWLDNKKVNTYF